MQHRLNYKRSKVETPTEPWFPFWQLVCGGLIFLLTPPITLLKVHFVEIVDFWVSFSTHRFDELGSSNTDALRQYLTSWESHKYDL